ncbi:restriction endonuclease [Priestia megaterium]|uniref:restriction endonuclease n=1 Tax=Priestia megaterium TaxID=1404 RepID=UPI001649C722|nr:restriction endonuclease [Priestia megaterium]
MVYESLERGKYEKGLLKGDMGYMDKMDGGEFEIYLEIVFGDLGYDGEVRKECGEFGGDLVMKRDEKMVVQVKG